MHKANFNKRYTFKNVHIYFNIGRIQKYNHVKCRLNNIIKRHIAYSKL